MITKYILATILICSIIIPFGAFFLSKKKEGNFKAALGFNAFFFIGTLLVGSVLLFGGNVSAAEATAVATTNGDGLKYIAAALSTGLACVGAGVAVGGAASAALGAISEDASIMGKSLIFVALAESISLYGLLISFSILAK